MVSNTTNHHCYGQCSIRNTGKKALLVAALTIVVSTSTLIATEAFQPLTMVASFGSSRASSTKLNYVVYGNDEAIGIEKNKKIGTTNNKTEKTRTIQTKKTKTDSKSQHHDNHGYIVANHDNERSFWLHALQNLESHPKYPITNQSLWTRIACAYGPSEFLFETTSSRIKRNNKDGAVLVRVGDADLDIALANVPSDSSILEHKNVVSATQDRRDGDRQLVTIRVDFPEGPSFDKNAFTFEDELTAVIEQVRMLEHTANDKLSKFEGL